MTTIEPAALSIATGGNPLGRAAIRRLVDSVAALAKGEHGARNAVIVNMGAVKRETGVSVKRDVPWQVLGGRTLAEALGL